MPRLPIDTVLLVIDAQAAGDNAVALLKAWRNARMPIMHIRSEGDANPAPSPGEPVITRTSHSGFAGTELEASLDARGATTLAVCGPPGDTIKETSGAAAALGYRVFTAAEAGAAFDVRDVVVTDTAALVQAAALARAIRDRHGR